MKIAYYPFTSDHNKYVFISQEILRSLGCDVIPFDKSLFKGKNMRETKAVFLNWYETFSAKNNARYFSIYLKRKIRIMQCKFLGIKVIFTFHNRFPHDSNQETINITRKFLVWICKKSDYIIILSKSSKRYLYELIDKDEAEKKIRYIPHPNYIGVYGAAIDRAPYYPHDKLRILFLGQIRPYKNVELIIGLAKQMEDKDIIFTVMGYCDNPDYEAKLRDEVSGLTNINFQFGFVADDLLEGFMRDSDILVLPYDKRSSLNSGTAILAFSNGRTVICPRIATIDDFNINNIYYYDYKDEEDHIEQLKKATLQAYADWKVNRNEFESKGKKLLEEVKKNNSVEHLRKLYASLLEEF